jgi:hypothetical protein
VVVNSDPDQQGHADVDRLVEEFLRR